MFETIIVYIVGTGVGAYICKQFLHEAIVTRTVDALIDEEYVRTYDDEDGVTHLYKWYERDEEEERDIWEKIETMLQEMKDNPEEYDPVIEDIVSEDDSALESVMGTMERKHNDD